MIEMGKTYRTRDNREVRIYAVDGGGCSPVHGAIRIGSIEWITDCWPANGQWAGAINRFNLVEVSHRSDCAVHNRPAYPAGPCSCGAITGPHTVEFTEGEGL